MRSFRPLPVPSNLHFTDDALGWFNGTIWPQIGAIAIIIAFGHSLLSMSGFETLAQVYREIAYPKLKNLKITANIVCIYAVFCTGVITLFAAMIIPDAVRGQYVDNLLGGLAMHLAGPPLLRLVFHIFVVIVGVLILSGAVNTSIIGANGVHEPRGRGRRAGGLVPQAAQALRHHVPHHQHDRAAADCSPSSAAAATSTCWAKLTRSAWCGASS